MTGGLKALQAHLAINVRKVTESVDFYRALFGVEPVTVRCGYAKFDLQNPPLNFTLNEVPVAGNGAGASCSAPAWPLFCASSLSASSQS